MLADAGRHLLQNPAHLQEAIHLTETAVAGLRDSPALGHIRLLALDRIGANPALSQEVDRLIAVTEKDACFQSILRDFLFARPDLWIINPLTYHKFLWENTPTTLTARLDSFRQTKTIPVGLNRIQARIKSVRPEEEDVNLELTDPEFTRRLVWGFLVRNYMRLLIFAAREIREKGQAADLTVEDHQILSLADENNNFITVDISPVQKACEDGRNVVILDTHAGFTIHSDLRLLTFGLPISVISAAPPVTDTPEMFNIATEGPDLQMRFLKLMKLMKTGQRIVRVFPDGGAGDVKSLDLLGIPVKVGQGAATLAWRGKADTFFPTSRWTGSKIHITFQAGPQASRDTSRSRFEEKMYEFYLTQWRNIVQGPPENMALIGGFWYCFQ